jgi:hypothetical protein
LLAAIGRVESDHGRFAGAVLHTDGTSTPRIIGIPLNGHGTALILDTDHGRLDGDTVYDHAVGPMQFIPSTWAEYGVDATHSGSADPFNIFDAAAAAARYLCAASSLDTVAGQTRAVLAYNHSDAYVAMVLELERSYAAGAGMVVPVTAGPVPSPGAGSLPPPDLPPVDPAPPPAAGPSATPTEPASEPTSTTPPSASSGPGDSSSSGSLPPSSSGPDASSAPGTSDPPAPSDATTDSGVGAPSTTPGPVVTPSGDPPPSS